MKRQRSRFLAAVLGLAVLITLTGCTRIPEDAEPERIYCTRKNYSLWGVQFTVDVTENEIVYASFFPESGAAEPVILEHQPISGEQWNAICTALQDFRRTNRPKGPAESAREMLGEVLFGRKTDGVDEYELRIRYEAGEVCYTSNPGELCGVLLDTVQAYSH